MVSIDFYRYVPTPVVYESEGQFLNIFKGVFDHSINKPDSLLDIVRARKLATIWLHDHYGEVIIQIDTDITDAIRVVVSNKKKMMRELTSLGLKIKLKRGK